jgi:hypothetical protein
MTVAQVLLEILYSLQDSFNFDINSIYENMGFKEVKYNVVEMSKILIGSIIFLNNRAED